MNRYFTFFLVLLLPAHCFSQDIGVGKAVYVAENFFWKITGKKHEVVKILPRISDDTVCYYDVLLDGNVSCMVSSTSCAPPVLSYSLNTDSFGEPDSMMPSAYAELVRWYVRQIKEIISGAIKTGGNPAWNALLGNVIVPDTMASFALLDSVDGFPVQWGQRGNNSSLYACEKSYNHECPWVPFISCNRAHAGCGPVAMAQLMRYWKWPKKSEYRVYHWEQMPCGITSLTDSIQAMEIACLLRDCGKSSNSIYSHFATGTLMGEMVKSFQDVFGYRSVMKYALSYWGYGDARKQLIVSELDNHRPVIMYGDHGFPDNGHYFIVDGYNKAFDQTHFHVNWGHRGKYNSFCLIDKFVEDYQNGEQDEYIRNNHVIVCVSPTYNESSINEVDYRNISPQHVRHEYAYDGVAIPQSGASLVVQSGGRFMVEAGTEIELLPGFEAKAGSEVDVRINPEWQSRMAISVPEWPTVSTVNGYCIKPHNADSWEFSVFDLGGGVVFQSAGSIRSDVVCLWDCANVSPGTYFCVVTLKNSFGRKMTNQHSFTVLNSIVSSSYDSDSSQHDVVFSTKPPSGVTDTVLVVFPNPSKDVFNVRLVVGDIDIVHVFDAQGHPVYADYNAGTREYVLNMRDFPKGLYTVRVSSDDDAHTATIIKR